LSPLSLYIYPFISFRPSPRPSTSLSINSQRCSSRRVCWPCFEQDNCRSHLRDRSEGDLDLSGYVHSTDQQGPQPLPPSPGMFLVFCQLACINVYQLLRNAPVLFTQSLARSVLFDPMMVMTCMPERRNYMYCTWSKLPTTGDSSSHGDVHTLAGIGEAPSGTISNKSEMPLLQQTSLDLRSLLCSCSITSLTSSAAWQ
jgi:hypothetical protein